MPEKFDGFSGGPVFPASGGIFNGSGLGVGDGGPEAVLPLPKITPEKCTWMPMPGDLFGQDGVGFVMCGPWIPSALMQAAKALERPGCCSCATTARGLVIVGISRETFGGLVKPHLSVVNITINAASAEEFGRSQRQAKDLIRRAIGPYGDQPQHGE